MSKKEQNKKKALDSIVGQKEIVRELSRVMEIFVSSNMKIRPHFILTGPSGSSKTFLIQLLAEILDINYFSVNAAQLTKEGVSGNSLSKALTPLGNLGNKPVICFVDEFDKLFISGNSNSSQAHDSTVGVQNEFLQILEHPTTQVMGDYGKYISVPTNNVLFVFAGAFNNEEDITLDRLREIGLKTEFLGRAGLVFNTEKLTLEDLLVILERSPLLESYLKLFKNVKRSDVISTLTEYLRDAYDNNDLGARIVNSLIHQYFIKGGLKEKEARKITFQKTLEL